MTTRRAATVVVWLLALGVLAWALSPSLLPMPLRETEAERLRLASDFMASRPGYEDLQQGIEQNTARASQETLANLRRGYPETFAEHEATVRQIVETYRIRSLDAIKTAPVKALAEVFTLDELRGLQNGDVVSFSTATRYLKWSTFKARVQVNMDRAKAQQKRYFERHVVASTCRLLECGTTSQPRD